MWAVGLLVYALAVFHRSSLGVAGLVAADRFGISASQLATFTMLQLLVYAGMQVPVGLLCDRFGSRSVLLVGTTLIALAQAAFAFSHSYVTALVARGFVGVGDAMTFVCVLRLVSSWFPSRRIPLVTQLTGTFGQLGAVMAAIPMTWALAHLGWTRAYLTAACDQPGRGGRRARPAPRRSRPPPPPGPADVGHGGAAQPARVVGPAGHPARVLDALHDAVQRHHHRTALGIPLPGPRRGAQPRDRRPAADRHGGGDDGVRPGPGLAGGRPSVAPLDDGAGHRGRHRHGLDSGAGLAGRCAAAACSSCSCWSPAWAARPR